MIPNPHVLLNKYDYLTNISGSIVELGFGHGVSANYFTRLVHENRLTTSDIWLYDSFEGFPEPTDVDKNSKRKPKKGEWAIENQLEKALDIKIRYPNIDVKVIKGFVEDVLPKIKPTKIKLLHIDLDIYPGYKASLDYLFDLVEEGGLIIFDEYDERYEDGSLKWPGAKLAIDQFLTSRNRLQDLVGYEKNKAYIIK